MLWTLNDLPDSCLFLAHYLGRIHGMLNLSVKSMHVLHACRFVHFICNKGKLQKLQKVMQSRFMGTEGSLTSPLPMLIVFLSVVVPNVVYSLLLRKPLTLRSTCSTAQKPLTVSL